MYNEIHLPAKVAKQQNKIFNMTKIYVPEIIYGVIFVVNQSQNESINL